MLTSITDNDITMARRGTCLGGLAPLSGNHSQSKSNIEDLSQPLEIRVKSDSGGFFMCIFQERAHDVRWASALRRPKRSGDRELWKNGVATPT